jgi:ABC-type proline/glycine betaine transport system permease subunit
MTMHVESFIGNLGLWLGTLVRFIVETLNGLFGAITEAGSNFVDGMARALGMDTSIISIAVLIIGLLFLYNAVRAFIRTSIIGGVIWLVLGLWILSWIIS